MAFRNDARVGLEDRNLYVESIAIDPPAGAPAIALTDGSELRAAREAREREIVDEATAAIEKHRKADAVVRVVHPDGRPVSGARVDLVQYRQDFLFGGNIYLFDRAKTPGQNAAYKDRFAGLFQYATVGFYWASYEREKGKPDYQYTDKVVAWCQGQGIAMKGHPLLWGDKAGIPPWSDGIPPLEAQKARVEAILGRYKGKIGLYEVVNEPAHNPLPRIDDPYRWARAADPSAKLIVNDYAVLADGYPPFRRLLEAAIRDGVPFDGVGIQAHEPVGMRFPLERVRDVLDRYAKLGKGLHITEFTPTSGGQPILGSHVQGTWDEAAQADYAAKFYRVCFAHPAVNAITWWDLSDQGAWQKGGGLLREDMSPKPAYEALRKLIRDEWMTRASGTTDQEGRFAFRGFYGTYRVGVKARGGPASRTATLSPDGPRELVVMVP
ncbi:MAG: endo-1,4-beta-xylanase [Isosphaeraceae bacterium]